METQARKKQKIEIQFENQFENQVENFESTYYIYICYDNDNLDIDNFSYFYYICFDPGCITWNIKVYTDFMVRFFDYLVKKGENPFVDSYNPRYDDSPIISIFVDIFNQFKYLFDHRHDTTFFTGIYPYKLDTTDFIYNNNEDDDEPDEYILDDIFLQKAKTLIGIINVFFNSEHYNKEIMEKELPHIMEYIDFLEKSFFPKINGSESLRDEAYNLQIREIISALEDSPKI
jgi:hypothetical protein